MLDEVESRLRLLEFRCRRPVEHLLAGEYRSVFRGRGVEFEDVRPYQPGDDVRTMDWKVTARTGQPHIKRYIEEREQFVYLLVDLSASMRYDEGGQKRETLVEAATLLTLAAVRNQDRVGLLLFTEQVEEVIPPGKGRRHALRILDALQNFQPEGRGTDLAEALQCFGHLARRPSIAFLLSDFLSEAFLLDLQALALRHDFNAIQIGDRGLPSLASGLLRMEDAESGQQQVVDLTAMAAKSALPEAGLRQELLAVGVDGLRLEVGADCVEALAGFFQARRRRDFDDSGE
ncbi:MAG: DUF58 domain-containing protein [Verrucomicrobiota bacterium]